MQRNVHSIRNNMKTSVENQYGKPVNQQSLCLFMQNDSFPQCGKDSTYLSTRNVAKFGFNCS